MGKTISATIPEKLLLQAEMLVREGWARDLSSIVTEAFRRYVESHPSNLTEAFIKEDVESGLRGDD